MSFRATVESMSQIMDDMGITELDLERQYLVYIVNIFICPRERLSQCRHFLRINRLKMEQQIM